MQTQETIVVEFNGTRKAILKEKLPEARQMEAHMQAAARKAGMPEQEIKEMFTLRIVEE
jgi:alkylhydroperoxidase/carboxymuconolactone decarboxylase family protein YurZ